AVQPNDAHRLLAELEQDFNVRIITQNVDDLHERAGSSNVLHLHGELKKVRSVLPGSEPIEWNLDLNVSDTDSQGIQLRPHIVWFGEEVPEMAAAEKIVEPADMFLVI